MTDLAGLVAGTEGLQPWRRIFHAMSGIVLALGPGLLSLSPEVTTRLLAIVAGLLMAGDLVRLRVPALNALFFRVFRRLASPREARRLASSTWYAVGAFLVWWWFPPPMAVAGLLVLGLADPAASVVGRWAGRRPLGKGSAEGTAAFALVAFLTLWPLVGPAAAASAAGLTALAEILPIPPDDNLVIPLVCAGALWLLGVA